MSQRFANVLACLRKLKAERPECQREVDIAVQMILGTRPNIEEKYDALLLKLDRTYSQLVDHRDFLEQKVATTPLYATRKNGKIKIAGINRMLSQLDWMRARNSDLIKVAANGSIQKASEAELPSEVPEQAD